MSFYENGLTWPSYLFIYIPPTPHVPVKLHCGRSLILWDWYGWTHPSNTHTVKNTLSNQHEWLFFYFPVFHRSFSLVIHKSAKCPFQAAHKHLIDLQKCHHTEARVVDGSEPTAVQLPTVSKWWMSKWMCTLQSARQSQWILGWGVPEG